MSLCTKHAAFLMGVEAPSPYASMLAAIMQASRCQACEIDAANRAAYLSGVRAGLEWAADKAGDRAAGARDGERYALSLLSDELRETDAESVAKEAADAAE